MKTKLTEGQVNDIYKVRSLAAGALSELQEMDVGDATDSDSLGAYADDLKEASRRLQVIANELAESEESAINAIRARHRSE